MATIFNTSEFFKGAYFAPIEVGEHEVTLDKVALVFEEDEEGRDKSYLAMDIKFENERVVSTRFYNIGAKIALDQIRNQLEDRADYKSVKDFVKAIKGRTVKCWISKRTYEANGKVNTTLQYDFLQPVASDEEEPF